MPASGERDLVAAMAAGTASGPTAPAVSTDAARCQTDEPATRLPWHAIIGGREGRKVTMASITIRKLSAESKERLRRRAAHSGRSLEARARSILDQAATEEPAESARFPHDLVAVVEPGEDIGPHIRALDEPHSPFDL